MPGKIKQIAITIFDDKYFWTAKEDFDIDPNTVTEKDIDGAILFIKLNLIELIKKCRDENA